MDFQEIFRNYVLYHSRNKSFYIFEKAIVFQILNYYGTFYFTQ